AGSTHRTATPSIARGALSRRTSTTMGRLPTCVRGPAPDRRAGIISTGRRSTEPTIVGERWRLPLPSSMRSSGDFPTVAAQRVHQLDRPLDELGRFIDFFH